MYRKSGCTPELRELLRDVVRVECRPYQCYQPTNGYVIKVIALCASAMPLFGYVLRSVVSKYQSHKAKSKAKYFISVKHKPRRSTSPSTNITFASFKWPNAGALPWDELEWTCQRLFLILEQIRLGVTEG